MSKYNTELQFAEFNTEGFAIDDGYAKIYQFNHDSREYMGTQLVFVLKSFGIPADSCLDEPTLPVNSDVAIVRSVDNDSWLHASDHRGKTAYSTETRQPIEIDFIGDLPDTLTLLEPKTEFDKWNGKKWVTDIEAQKAVLVAQAEQEKAQRLEEANATITYLQDAIEVGLDNDDYQAKLTAWKTYRVLLNRVDTSLAPDIDWPEKSE
ncbi:tail fiber assembly protein [Providencia hangzhouensis]|uniref:tail fiber assembly protein n=1 Tax=Providencia hangzhouensis TaxID=3031799 RepID=UPI003F49CDB8